MHWVLHIRRLIPSQPPQSKLQFSRGGNTGTIRCKCAISADTPEPPATQKCQFSGFSRTSRPPFQRKIVTKCKMCNKKEKLNPLFIQTLSIDLLESI
jgi:hypothetical protein